MVKESRAGILRKNLFGELEYYSFVPTKLPPIPGILIDSELSKTLIELHKVLAVLDDKSKNIPDMNLFVSMYVQKKPYYHHKLRVFKQYWKIFLIQKLKKI